VGGGRGAGGKSANQARPEPYGSAEPHFGDAARTTEWAPIGVYDRLVHVLDVRRVYGDSSARASLPPARNLVVRERSDRCRSQLAVHLPPRTANRRGGSRA